MWLLPMIATYWGYSIEAIFQISTAEWENRGLLSEGGGVIKRAIEWGLFFTGAF